MTRIAEDRVLLGVTGSRAVVDRPASAAWARAMVATHVDLARALAAAHRRVPLLVTGCAKLGGDAYTRELAAERDCDVVVFDVDGFETLFAGGTTVRYSAPWFAGDAAEFRALDFKTRALQRNIEIGRFLRAHILVACPAWLLGVRAPWSRTHGTDHTLRHAREMRVPTVPETFGEEPRRQPRLL